MTPEIPRIKIGEDIVEMVVTMFSSDTPRPKCAISPAVATINITALFLTEIQSIRLKIKL
jgi:hypothetical protein